MNSGETFTLSDGRQVKILPLTLNAKLRLDKSKAWKRVRPKSVPAGMGEAEIEEWLAKATEEQTEAMIEIAHEVLKKGQPDLTPEQVGDMIDAKVVGEFMVVVNRVNGLTIDGKEVKTSGEVTSP